MNITCGTDIIEISRIKELITSDMGEKFLERVYTKKEVEYCNLKNDNKFQHFAARFAAKEAVFKAISKKLDNKFDINWNQIQIENDKFGRPYVKLDHEIFLKIDCIDLSMSHCSKYATATVIVNFKGE